MQRAWRAGARAAAADVPAPRVGGKEVGLSGCPADAGAGPMGRRRSGGRDRRRGVRRRPAAREPARDVGSRVRRRRWRARTPLAAVSIQQSARNPARSAARVPVEGGRGPLYGSRSTAASSRQPLLEGAPGAGDVRRPCAGPAATASPRSLRRAVRSAAPRAGPVACQDSGPGERVGRRPGPCRALARLRPSRWPRRDGGGPGTSPSGPAQNSTDSRT